GIIFLLSYKDFSMRPVVLFLILVGLPGSCESPTSQVDKKSLDKPLAVQLWTFRLELEKDVPGTLKKIRDLGFTYVEGFDAPFIVGNPDAFKSQLDAAGLKMFALHW